MPLSNDSLSKLLKEGSDITGATMPEGGSSARGWLSAIWKTITNIFPSALSNGRFKTELSHLAPFEINCTATALGDILPETDVSNYRFASVSVNSNVAANQMQFLGRNSQTSVWFTIPVEQRLSPNGSYLGVTTGAQNIYGVPLAYKYFKITLVAYTANTTSNITVLLYQHPPERLTVVGRVLVDGGNLTVGLPASSNLSDGLSRSISTPILGVVNLLDNNFTNTVRWKTPAVNVGEGVGRGKVAIGTEPITLGSTISAVSTGSTFLLGSAYSKITMQMVVTGTLSAINCSLEGSLNSGVWFNLATLTDTTNGARVTSLDVPVTHIRYKLNSVSGTGLSLQFYACAT